MRQFQWGTIIQNIPYCKYFYTIQGGGSEWGYYYHIYASQDGQFHVCEDLEYARDQFWQENSDMNDDQVRKLITTTPVKIFTQLNDVIEYLNDFGDNDLETLTQTITQDYNNLDKTNFNNVDSIYEENEKEKIHSSIIEYSLLKRCEIDEFFQDDECVHSITEDALNLINKELDKIFFILAGYHNVFEMVNSLKPFFRDHHLLKDLKSNIALKCSNVRSNFELYQEIFVEIVETLIKQMYIQEMKNLSINLDNINEFFDSVYQENIELVNWMEVAINK